MVRLFSLIFIIINMLTMPLYATDNFSVNMNLSKDTVWQREQVMLTLEVITDDALSRLESKDYQQTGLSITPYPLEIIEEANTGKTKLKLKWAIFSFTDQKHDLKLPRIRYRPSRGRPVTLDIPKVTLNINTLPIYVSPTMPVGKISLSAQWQDGMVITSHKLSEWQISVNAEHVAPATLPIITNQLKDDDFIQFLPTKKRRSLIKNTSGIKHKQQYTIPIKALSFGRLNLPEIRIQYFDPETSTLKIARQKPPWVIVIHPWIIGLLAFIFLILLILLSIISFPHIKHYLQKRSQKKQALTALKHAKSYPQIRYALMQYASSKGWGSNMTLQDFSRYLKATEDSKKSVNNIIKQLEYAEFSMDKNDEFKPNIDEIKNRLHRLLNNSR